MSDRNSYTLEEELRDQLPPRYQSWLQFYDELPEALRLEPVVQACETLTRENYRLEFDRELQGGYREAEITYQIRRDFMLARVAEQLLPARHSKGSLHSLLTQAYQRELRIDAVKEVVDRLWEVATK